MRSMFLWMCGLTIGAGALARDFTPLEVESACLHREDRAGPKSECRKMARDGNSTAAFYMGAHYQKADPDEARRWYARAIELGDTDNARRALSYMNSARDQGRLETLAAWGGLLLLGVPLLLACRKQAAPRSCGHRLLLLYPYPLAGAVLLLHESTGRWGGLKHPWLASLAQHVPVTLSLWLLAGVAVSYLPTGIFLFRARVLPRWHVVISLAVFYGLLLVGLAFLVAMAGLASQGAGR